MTTDNFWAYYDTHSTVWNAFVLDATKPTLFMVNLPGMELAADLAASGDPSPAKPDGEGFSVDVPMREDAEWSDGAPITAADVVFTADTVRDLSLGGRWADAYTWASPGGATNSRDIGLTSVEAIDEYTVRFTWNAPPGLAVWPYGVGLAPIMPMHFWKETVLAATSGGGATTLYSATGVGDPSGGPMVFDGREAGAFARTVANTEYNGFAGYHNAGRVVTSGGVTYQVGPFIADQIFSLYGDQRSAVLALKAGNLDYLYTPLGLMRGLLMEIAGDEGLTYVTNHRNAIRHLGFNLRVAPMSIQGFRDAVAFMLDKEAVANGILQNAVSPMYATNTTWYDNSIPQNAVSPMYATVPRGNTTWYDADRADAYRATYQELSLDTRYDGRPFTTPGNDGIGGTDDDKRYTASGPEARLHAAVKALLDAGFSFPDPGDFPSYVDDAVQGACGISGGGCILYNGVEVGHLEILAPEPAYDAYRTTYALTVARVLRDLGFDAAVETQDFDVLVDRVYTPTDEGTLNYQMYVLGAYLGSPAFPTYHEVFWAGANDTLGPAYGDNTTGYNNPEFNALVDQYMQASTIEEAYAILWQLEDIVFRDKPIIPLFEAGILEVFRSDSVAFPFTETLSGLQAGLGFPSLVDAAD